MGDLGVRRQGQQQQHSGRQHRVPRARASSPYASSATGRGGGGSQSPSRRSAAAVNVYVTQPQLASPVPQPQWERKQAEAAERCVEPLPQLAAKQSLITSLVAMIIMMAAEARWRHSVNNGHQLDNRSAAVATMGRCRGLSQAGTAFMLCVYNAVGCGCVGVSLTLSLCCPCPSRLDQLLGSSVAHPSDTFGFTSPIAANSECYKLWSCNATAPHSLTFSTLSLCAQLKRLASGGISRH